jgi:regulator of nucleoside diphosphate kinase
VSIALEKDMKTMLLEQTVLVRDLDHVRLRDWLDELSTPEHHGLDYIDGLRRKLCDARVVTLRGLPRNVVTMNSLVGLRDVELEETLTRYLAYPDEADPRQQKVSVAVPLGTEMLGRPVGAVIAFAVPSGVRQMRIERVYYQPEAAGDYHM